MRPSLDLPTFDGVGPRAAASTLRAMWGLGTKPLQNLVQSFLHRSVSTASKYEARREDKGKYLLQQVRDTAAEGVIFAAPSFCDPALLDRPMLLGVLAQHNIPCTAFKYAENTGQMAPIREQAGTFADSIKLWSAA